MSVANDDDDQTSIYDPSKRPKKSTQRGHGTSEDTRALTPPTKRDQEAVRKRAIELATPTAIDVPVPIAPQRDRSEPIRVISMKTPGADRGALEAKAHKVKLRAMSDVSSGRLTPPRGHLAPPRDVKQARVRRMRDLVIWSCAVIVIGSLVMIAVWLLAR